MLRSPTSVRTLNLIGKCCDCNDACDLDLCEICRLIREEEQMRAEEQAVRDEHEAQRMEAELEAENAYYAALADEA